MIPFNKPPLTGNEQQYVLQAMQSNKISGDGIFGRKCQAWFEQYLPCLKALMTPSCTAALEMAALLIDVRPGDEIIMPSYTFVSTANAFALRGAKIIFVDICPDTLNIDANLIEAAITPKTRAIVPVHYAGVSCNMCDIMELADRYNLYVIEDAAQAIMSTYQDRSLGTIGHFGALSFHETKNFTSGGEGGLLIINDERFINRAEVIREKGTNRSQFFRGQVDKYTWVDIGSSYLPSELQAAYLWGQLEMAGDITKNRLRTWNEYYNALRGLQKKNKITLATIPENCSHNAHMFYIKLSHLEERTSFIDHMSTNNIQVAFHYVPLHSSPAGCNLGTFHGTDNYTTRESERLVRLPIYYGMTSAECSSVSQAITKFFG